jgi:tol-pal system protein YbgF
MNFSQRARYEATFAIAMVAAALVWTTPAQSRSGQTGGGSAQAGKQEAVGERVASLEERLIDLQVQVATLRSLAANVGAAVTRQPAGASFQYSSDGFGNGQQIAALETEMRAISSELKAISGRPTGILPGATTALKPQADNRPISSGAENSGWAGSTTVTPNTAIGGAGPAPSPYVGPVDRGGELLPGAVYGNQNNSAIGDGRGFPAPGNSVAGWANPNAGVVPQAGGETGQQTRQPAVQAGDAESDYQAAYGYLLQQDYGAAQAAFQEFLARYPTAQLAGNAQYWLGETHYVRGAYKEAAVAFLRGYEKYGDGNKGPDSLLKLALSLGKLNQTTAACSSLRELGTRYRTGPQNLLNRATTEMQRMRCPQ